MAVLGHYPHLETHFLMSPVLLPVASPKLIKQDTIHQAKDCLAYPLLQDIHRKDWALWLAAHGVDSDSRASKGMAFSDDYLLIKAAIAAQGIALIPQEYAKEEIEMGRLVQVLDLPWPKEFASYMVNIPTEPLREEIQQFKTWLLNSLLAT